MPYSLAEAAAATGLNKTTVLRSIKAGHITGTKDALGQWQIEPAELHRVHPQVAAIAVRTEATPDDAAATSAAVDTAELRARVSLAEQRLAEMKAMLEDVRAQRDAGPARAEREALTDEAVRQWARRDETEHQTLTDERVEPPSWWNRLAG